MFEVLQNFGNALFNYYIDLFDENEIFSLIVTKEILEKCCQNAGITVSDLENDLRFDPKTSYRSDNPYVCIAIAAYQVFLLSEVRINDNSDNAFEVRLVDFYRLNNVAALYRIFEQEINRNNRNCQWGIWFKVQQHFLQCKRRLVIENSRHQNHRYLQFPETQLDFLITAKYDLELICKRYRFSSQSSCEEINNIVSRQFKPILNSSRNLKRAASPEHKEITQVNLLKLFSLYTYVYSRRNSNSENPAAIDIAENIQSDYYDFAFDYESDNNEYRLCVLEHGLEILSSDEKMRWNTLSERLENDTDSCCGIFEQDEYGFIYNEGPDDSTFKKDFLFVSKEQDINLIDYLVYSFSTSYYVYKIPADAEKLEEIVTYVKQKIYGSAVADEETVIDASVISKFIGGIKIGKNWLLGCEPKVPDNCSPINFDSEKGKTYYPSINNKIIPITIIDRNNPDKLCIEEKNVGWNIYSSDNASFPVVDGYNVVSTEKKSSDLKAEENTFKEKPFKHDRFIGEFDGTTILVKESYMLVANTPVPIEDNYILKADEKELLKKIKIIPDKQLFIGDRVTFRIKANSDNSIFQAVIEENSICNRKIYEGYFDGKKVVNIEKNFPFENRIIRPNMKVPVGTSFKFSVLVDSTDSENLLAVINPETIKKPYDELVFRRLGYKKYIKNEDMQAAWFDTIDGFPGNFCINMPLRKIERSAVHFGAYCRSFSADNNLIDDKKLLNFINDAQNHIQNQYFIVIKYEKQIHELVTELRLPENIYADNIKVFFVRKESKSENEIELENEDLECQFSDNKDMELERKQQQLLWWIEYEGFVTWDKVRNKCNKLIESDADNIRNDYEKYGAVYQIFYPLVISGKVEVCKNTINTTDIFGFCISKKWEENLLQDELNRRADCILDDFPTISSVIQGWKESYNVYSDSEVYSILNTQNGYAFAQNPGRIDNLVEAYKAIIFKTKPVKAPYIPRNIAWKDTQSGFFIMKEIPVEKYCDANFYVNCFTECRKEHNIFEYSQERCELKCNKALPVLLQRALLMYDKNRLTNAKLISGSKWSEPYKNITPETVNKLNRIFEIKINEV